MPSAEQLNEAAIRNIGRNPLWSNQSNTASRPSTSTSGVYLENSPKTILGIALREDVSGRIARYTVTTFNAGGTYNFIIGGTTIAVVGPHADVETLLTNMAANIAANPTVNALVSSYAYDSDGNDASVSGNDPVGVLIKGRASAHYTVNRNETAGVAQVEAEPETCNYEVYLLAGGTAKAAATSPVPTSWYRLEAAASVNDGNLAKRYNTAGFQRLAAYLYGLAGSGDANVIYKQPTVSVGPAVDE